MLHVQFRLENTGLFQHQGDDITAAGPAENRTSRESRIGDARGRGGAARPGTHRGGIERPRGESRAGGVRAAPSRAAGAGRTGARPSSSSRWRPQPEEGAADPDPERPASARARAPSAAERSVWAAGAPRVTPDTDTDTAPAPRWEPHGAAGVARRASRLRARGSRQPRPRPEEGPSLRDRANQGARGARLGTREPRRPEAWGSGLPGFCPFVLLR